MLGCQEDQKKRKRESTEKPKATRISKVGTVIRCRRCKQVGHNRSTCEKRNGVPPPSGPSRGASSTSPSVLPRGASSTPNSRNPNPRKANVTKASAMAKVRASRGGTGSIKLHAQVPRSQASSSATVIVKSGSAFGKVSVQEPTKRKKSTPAKYQEYLMLPPSGPSKI